MYEAKTKPTDMSVASYLAAIQDESRRKDCEEVAALMEKVTGCQPKMWGTSIVGFDQYHYKYTSGHEGDACVVGFSSRKNALTIYLMGIYENAKARELLDRLGKYKAGKGCLYLQRLSDVDVNVLEKLVAFSASETRRRYSRDGS